MSELPALESLQRPPLPDSPPELVSPSATSYSSRSSPSTEQATWGPHASAPLTSMSNYDKASPAGLSIETGTENSKGRPESLANSTPRQQLPSLSSLFGPPPSSVRPRNSPRSDRAGPYVSHSPLNRPRLLSGASSSGSYFPRTVSPPASQPRSTYDVKFDAERQSAHALSSSFPGSRSPGYRDVNHGRPDLRYHPETANRWSMHQEASRQEYALGSRDGPYRSPRDKFRPQFPGSKDAVHDYSEQRPGQIHGSISNPPSTPTSTVASDITLSKDGLGPKIWTGTHFLPRFVRAAEVPGEGMCYFYDDGSHCKTVIDGEAVNAHWGVTKAGKPRKRLAIACVTCREKKIKCDPDYPRCVQCEKFGRICKFKNAPRGGHNTSPSTPPAELDDSRQPSKPVDMRRSVSDDGSPISPRAGAHPSSPDAGYSKRLKVGPETYVPNGEPSAPFAAPMDHSKSHMTEQRPASEMPRIPDDVLSRAWRTDPYVSDPQSITAVLTKFFAHVDSSIIIRFLPEEVFKNWVARSAHRKTPEDMMLLYSTLAIGVALSGGPKHIAFEYAQVAHYAQKMSAVNCLQLVQSRILLAVYYASTCRTREANELISSAVATATCLQLNLELKHSTDAAMTVYPLGMNKAGYAEARRRTFWSLFMLERLSGLFPDRPAMINAEDIYTRLPADCSSFEKLVETHMPRFDPYESCFAKLAEKPSEMAGYLVEMVHIWSECQAAIYRMASRPTPSEAEAARLQNLIKKTEDWRAALPSRLAFGGSNLESAAFAGNIGSFLSMHLLYHHATIELNRHRHGATQLAKEVRMDHLQKCQDHAASIIDMLTSLDRILRLRPAILSTPPPAVAMAVIEAVDVLTAGGLMTGLDDVIESVQIAKSAVDKVTNIWEASSRSGSAIDQRLQQLIRIRDQGSQPASPVEGYRLLPSSEETKRWQISDPIEKLFSKDMDIVYVALDY